MVDLELLKWKIGDLITRTDYGAVEITNLEWVGYDDYDEPLYELTFVQLETNQRRTLQLNEYNVRNFNHDYRWAIGRIRR